MTLAATPTGPKAARPRIWNDPWWRALFIQAVLLIVVVAGLLAAAQNARVNMTSRGIPTDFSFWDRPAGFDVNQTLIPFNATYSYGRAFLVGLLNTLVVAAIGVVFATILGFAIGAARLSQSWLVARLATIYVETIRNVPLLLQLLFWYNAVLSPLPGPRNSVPIFNLAFLNNRGLFVPEPMPLAGFEAVAGAFAVGIAAAVLFRFVARKRQRETGRQWPVGRVSAALVLGLPLLVYFALGRPLDWSVPVLKGFNFQGGVRLTPEFVALTSGAGSLHRVLHRRNRAQRPSRGLAWPDGGRARARPRARSDAPACDHAAGHARDHSAADEPVSQHHEELVPRRVHRLSRPGAGLRGHGPQPDRRGRPGHRHHDGGLPCHLARDLDRDELVQQPHGAEGAMT